MKQHEAIGKKHTYFFNSISLGIVEFGIQQPTNLVVLRHLQYATKLSTISYLRTHQSIPIHHIVVCFTLGSYPACCARYAFCTMVRFNVTSHPSPFRVPLRADVRGCRVERQGHPVALGRPRRGLWQIPGWLSYFSGISLARVGPSNQIRIREFEWS